MLYDRQFSRFRKIITGQGCHAIPFYGYYFYKYFGFMVSLLKHVFFFIFQAPVSCLLFVNTFLILPLGLLKTLKKSISRP